MRDKLAQVRRVREIRAESRKRDWAAERQKLNNIDNSIAQMQQRKKSLEQEASNRLQQFSASNERMSGPEINALKTTIEALKRESLQVIQQIGQAQKERIQAVKRVQMAVDAMKAADRAVDQFLRLDEKLAEEETKEFERAEEAENEIIPKLKKKPLLSDS
jgi:uncharacterized protein YqgV (UPF0045/DUF77 family)